MGRRGRRGGWRGGAKEHKISVSVAHVRLPDSSTGKESACSAGGPTPMTGSDSCPGEGTGCPLQYSWASLVAQPVKNPPATRET